VVQPLVVDRENKVPVVAAGSLVDEAGHPRYIKLAPCHVLFFRYC